MYEIEINQTVCYDDTQIDDASYRLIDYKLVMEDNKAGSLTLVVPPTNRAYNQCSPNTIRRRPLVYFFENEKMLWIGRAVSVKYDFWNRATVVCEGALAWLADALYEGLDRQAVQTDTDVADTKIQGALSGYTRHMSTSAYRIEQGIVTMQIEGEAEWTGIQQGYSPAQSPDTTKTCLQRITDLVSRYGGHVQVLIPSGRLPRLAWYADIYGTAQSGSYVQTANFGENLMDYVRSFSTDGLVTVLRPYGDIKDNAPKVEQEKTALITSDMLTNYRRINTSGEVENSPSSLQNVSDPLTIVRGRKYYYSGHMRSNFCLFVITDTDGNVYNLKTNHGGEPTGSTVIKEYNNVEIPIPEFAQNGSYKIQCGFWQDTAYETEKSVTLLDYSNLYYVDEDQSEDDDKYRIKLTDSGYPTETYEISDLVQEYGWIEERVTFKNINNATGLLAATQTLADEIVRSGFNFESLSVGFLDMAYFIQSDAPKVGTALVGSAVLSDVVSRVPPLKLYDGVRVVSDPHHVDTVMYVTKIELSINPANSKITLGVSKEKGISALVGG